MRLPPNHDIECCSLTCTKHGTTSDTADLPLGWTFRRTMGNDEESVLLLIYCPDCSSERGTDTLTRGT